MTKTPSERLIVLLIAAVQFINILDFVMVMPMGPDFARALAIPTSKLGMIGGSYTAAAAVSGLLGSFFLDRFDRRSVLAVSMLGLVTGTAMGGLATGLGSLMAARVVAGCFGGPATSVALAIITDAVPAERRGKALGTVMSAFSVASVLGVPAGLRLALVGGWRAPFFTVAAVGLVVAGAAVLLLPSMRRHLDSAQRHSTSFGELLGRADVRLSYAMTFLAMASGFILIPNISAYVQGNLHFPRERLDLLYVAGGVVSFVSTNTVGRLVDRYGSFRTGTAGVMLVSLVVYAGFASYSPGNGLAFLPGGEGPVFGLFVGMMLGMSFRNVSYTTLTSKVPGPAERARFMSLQSMVQHMASAAGAFLSSLLLVELPDHTLEGIPRIAWLSIALSAVLPVLLAAVERRVRMRSAPGGLAVPA